MKHYKVCMTAAGSDPSGGAGIQADLKTFTLLGCYGQAVPTALTVQNTVGVKRSVAVDAGLVYAQMQAVMSDCPPQALKIGMLPTAEVAQAVAKAVREFRPAFVVLDPVMISSSGLPLMSESARETIREELMPLCSLVTPNLPEARVLLHDDEAEPEVLAQRLSREMGGVPVLVKGGHRAGNPVDVLFDGELHFFDGQRVDTPNSHGTGCVLSSAIAANKCRGVKLSTAVARAKSFLDNALRRGADFRCGQGCGPLYLLPPESDADGRN